jgi:signal peptidase I
MKQQIIEWTRFLATVFAMVFAINTIAFASFHIPSESMIPTLAVGDRVVVSKFTYGYSKHSVPFSLAPAVPSDTGRILSSTPERGDIVVFRHTNDEITMIKRVIGLPGERIQMMGGRLYLNGELVERNKLRSYTFNDRRGSAHEVNEYTEILPGGYEHVIVEITDAGMLDNTAEITIPEGHLFMMGDNRDMSSDSRRMTHLGTVPLENLIGKARIISFSLNTCGKSNPEICAASRTLKRLH